MQRFDVRGMTCDHCRQAVIRSIQSRDPGASVVVDLEKGAVAVSSDGLSDESIREAIKEEGYEVQ